MQTLMREHTFAYPADACNRRQAADSGTPETGEAAQNGPWASRSGGTRGDE
jgi:hypothetical protein